MDIVLLVLAIVCGLLGIVGCVVPALPGPPLTYLGIWFVQWSGYAHLDTSVMVIWGVVTVVVTVIDFLLAPWMTKRFGGSKAGSWGSIVGLFAGMFLPLPPLVGPLVGPFLGAYLAEIWVSKKDSRTALHAALGSFLSFFVGTGIKLMVCIGMVVHLIMG